MEMKNKLIERCDALLARPDSEKIRAFDGAVDRIKDRISTVGWSVAENECCDILENIERRCDGRAII